MIRRLSILLLIVGCDANKLDNNLNIYYGNSIYESSNNPTISGASVPFIYYENNQYYLYMCKNTDGHHVSTSLDGNLFSEPQPTGIGACGLNFVKINNGSYRLYTSSIEFSETGSEIINCKSAVFNDLLDLGPQNRIDENGIRFSSSDYPCENFIGTLNVIKFHPSNDSVRVYCSCGKPNSSMASFTSASDGLTFGTSDGILIEQAIDAEIQVINGGFRVFYTLMNRDIHPDIQPFKPQEIMTAFSTDGINWVNNRIIANVESVSLGLAEDLEYLADPTAVMLNDDSWRIYFGSKNKNSQIEYIYSFIWKE